MHRHQAPHLPTPHCRRQAPVGSGLPRAQAAASPSPSLRRAAASAAPSPSLAVTDCQVPEAPRPVRPFLPGCSPIVACRHFQDGQRGHKRYAEECGLENSWRFGDYRPKPTSC